VKKNRIKKDFYLEKLALEKGATSKNFYFSVKQSQKLIGKILCQIIP
jgi:hypothetical protein